MKADRLVALLLLLQSRRQCSARVLAEHLEVSERTIYRDVDALSAAGVPVYAERGATGGIVLSDGYRRALTYFSEDEVRALFASGASPLADLGLERGLTRALEKLRGGLADVHQRAADKSRSRIHLDQRRWNQPEPPRDLLTALRRAVWDDRCLRIRYEDRNRKSSMRVSTLWVWFVRRAFGIWSLARTVSCAASASIGCAAPKKLAEHFERPEDFDLERYWAESSARFAEASRTADCVVTFCVPNDALERVTYYWPAEMLSQDASETRVRVTFPGREVALFQVLAWSDVATLVEPAALRDEIVAPSAARA